MSLGQRLNSFLKLCTKYWENLVFIKCSGGTQDSRQGQKRNKKFWDVLIWAQDHTVYRREWGGGQSIPILREKGGGGTWPSLDTGLGKTYIIIFFLSNWHMHSNVPASLLNKNCNIAPNLHAYNFSSNFFTFL